MRAPQHPPAESASRVPQPHAHLVVLVGRIVDVAGLLKCKC
jgi:hypothetical protein